MCSLARVLSRKIWRYIYFQLEFRNHSNYQNKEWGTFQKRLSRRKQSVQGSNSVGQHSSITYDSFTEIYFKISVYDKKQSCEDFCQNIVVDKEA
jgi:hypothetical protein